MAELVAELCESLHTLDRKDEYVVEAAIPAENCRLIQIVFDAYSLDLNVVPLDSDEPIPIHSWEFASGVTPENLTAQHLNGTLFIRVPKNGVAGWAPPRMNYRETIEIVPRPR